MAIEAPKEESQRGRKIVLRSIMPSSEWTLEMVAIRIFGVDIEMMGDMEGSWTDCYYYRADGRIPCNTCLKKTANCEQC